MCHIPVAKGGVYNSSAVEPIKLGGPGTIVQIDESLMNHKPKVIYMKE